MIVIGIVFSVLGLVFIAAFVLSRIQCRTAVEATVSRLMEKKTVFRGTTIREYTPVFTYAVDNKTYTQKADLTTHDPKKYFVGQKVTVRVNLRKPSEMRFGSNIGILLSGFVFLLLGVLFLVLFFL